MYKQVIKYLPSQLKTRIESPGGKKIFQNILWLYGDKIFRLGGGLLIGIMIARYLGPSNYGLYNFAFSFVWIFENVVTLGMNEVLMREIIFHPRKEKEILGSAFGLRLIGALIAFVLIVTGIFLIRADNEVRLIVAIMAIGMMIKNAAVIKFFFEANVKSKYSVIAENISYVIFSLVKLFLILAHYEIIWFVWAYTAEAVVSSIFYIYFFKKLEGTILDWRFNFSLARKLINDSWVLIFTGLCTMVYIRGDQVLIAQMAGDAAAGIYSAAVRISELWLFIPATILVSFFPSIAASKEVDKKQYIIKLQRLFDIITIISVSVALPVSLLSPIIISLLYGPQYQAAAAVLSIHIWSATFLILMVASARYLIIENLQKHLFFRSLFGALLNVVLNVVLIPLYGPVGAAIATFVSYGLATFSTFYFTKTKQITVVMFSAFNFLRIYNLYTGKGKVFNQGK